MVLGDKPLSQVTFVTGGDHFRNDLTKFGAKDEEDRRPKGKLGIAISQRMTFYAKPAPLEKA